MSERNLAKKCPLKNIDIDKKVEYVEPLAIKGIVLSQQKHISKIS